MDSASPPAPSAECVVRITEALERPALDKRTYRVIRLANKLEALLIHDPETDRASAALDVKVGSFSDPEDIPGVAHAVEHVLFMGTTKFPSENEYSQYLAAHSGFSNAYTASTSTNYYFEVSALPAVSSSDQINNSRVSSETESSSPLRGSLDRFAQFFISPLFSPSTLDRELRAVDSENKKNLQSDTWRLNQLNKSLSNPAHPFSHFSTGNYFTLHDDLIARGIPIRDKFIEFYRSEYSANRMKLAVLGRESLDLLEKWVVEFFSPIENKDLPERRWDYSPYTEEQLGTQIFAKPVFDIRSVELYFPYPDEDEIYDCQPSWYLSHLIGHEGPGSILAHLKSKGWATSLGAGPMNLCPGSAFFTISIRLTEAGPANYQDVVRVVFQYIGLLRKIPPQKWIHDEIARMAELDFRFRETGATSGATSRLCSAMQRPFAREHILSGSALLRRFDPDQIKKGLDCLTPRNLRMTQVSQNYPGRWQHKEKWYGTEYSVERIPSDFMTQLIEAWDNKIPCPSDLRLPAPNDFIPTEAVIKPPSNQDKKPLKRPTLIHLTPLMRVWYKLDDRVWVPRTHVTIWIKSPIAGTSARIAVLQQLVFNVLVERLSEYAYAAEIAGLEYVALSNDREIELTFHGYSQNLPILVERVLLALSSLEISQDRFEVVREKLWKTLKNFDFLQPYQIISSYSRWLAVEGCFSNSTLLAEVGEVTLDEVLSFNRVAIGHCHLEILAHGDLPREAVMSLAEMVKRTLGNPMAFPVDQLPPRRPILVPPGSQYAYELEHRDPANANGCVELILRVGSCQDRDLQARLALFAQIAQEPAFDKLRTKEQLGYIVWSGVVPADSSNPCLGFRVLVQSDQSTHYVETRIEAFLADLRAIISRLTPVQLAKQKQSVINRLMERPHNLGQEAGRFRAAIACQTLDFLQRERCARAVSRLDKADILQFYESLIAPESTNRVKLVLRVRANPAARAKTLANRIQSAVPAIDAELLNSRLQNALEMARRSRVQQGCEAGADTNSSGPVSGSESDRACVDEMSCNEDGLFMRVVNEFLTEHSSVLTATDVERALAGLQETRVGMVASSGEDEYHHQTPGSIGGSDGGGNMATEARETRPGPREKVLFKPATVIRDVRAFQAQMELGSAVRVVRCDGRLCGMDVAQALKDYQTDWTEQETIRENEAEERVTQKKLGVDEVVVEPGMSGDPKHPRAEKTSSRL